MASVKFILSNQAKVRLTYLGAGDLQDLVKLGQYTVTERQAQRLRVLLLKLGLTIEESSKRAKQKVVRVDAGEVPDA